MLVTVREATTASPCFSTIFWVPDAKGTVSAKGAVVIGVVLSPGELMSPGELLSPKPNETSKHVPDSFALLASYSSRQYAVPGGGLPSGLVCVCR